MLPTAEMMRFRPGSRLGTCGASCGYSVPYAYTPLRRPDDGSWGSMKPLGNCLAIAEPGGNGAWAMFRGRLNRVVLPDLVSTLATTMVSVRVPIRPTPASLPTRKMLIRGFLIASTSPAGTVALLVLGNSALSRLRWALTV